MTDHFGGPRSHRDMHTVSLKTFAIFGFFVSACNADVDLGNRDAQGGGTFVAIGGASAGGQTAFGTIVGGQTSVISVCGDGIIQSGELCDDANTMTGDGCVANCTTVEPGWACSTPGQACTRLQCGDGIVDSAHDEQCDYGIAANDGSYGGCTPQCKSGPYCGDGVVNGPEQCDYGADANGDGYGGCTVTCKLGPHCGDGIVNGPEACDDGTNSGSYGTCSPACKLVAYCGDGVVNGSEACDDGVNNGGVGSCSPRCGATSGDCGDGIADTAKGEECDNGVAGNVGSYGGCTASCKLAAYCGDGIVQSQYGEECDIGQLSGALGQLCSVACQRVIL